MNENTNTTAVNEINIHVGAIKHPENGSQIFEGLDINAKFSDKAYAEECTAQLNLLKILLPVISSKIDVAIEHEQKSREDRVVAIKADYEAAVKDWEERKAKAEKEHEAWAERKAQVKDGEKFYECEPRFTDSRPRLYL